MEPVHLRDRLELIDVHYSYPLAERPALRGLTLSIPARTTVGIVGGTGAGKTTAVDLILGLLELQQGRIEADGVPIGRGEPARLAEHASATCRSRSSSPTPPSRPTSPSACRRRRSTRRRSSARRASPSCTTSSPSELPQGYDTPVGERGVRLSGGQRQRIGIARALYHDPDVLIMDEATSALDNLTERAVMDAVHNLGHAKTIILIAHRLTTVQACDIIFMMEQGRLVAQGTYEELLEKSGKFRAMAVGDPLG